LRIAARCRRPSLFEATRESLEDVPQVARRTLETAQAIARADERDEQEDDDEPQEEHLVPALEKGEGGSKNPDVVRAGLRVHVLTEDVSPSITVTLTHSDRASVPTLGGSHRQAEV
jgi:hypothetical protein